MPKALRLSGAAIAFLFGLTAFAAGVSFAIKGFHQGGDFVALGEMCGALYMGIGWIMAVIAYFMATGKCPL